MSYLDFFITQNFKIMTSQKNDDVIKCVIAYLEKKALNIFEITRMYSNIIDKVSLNQDTIIQLMVPLNYLSCKVLASIHKNT